MFITYNKYSKYKINKRSHHSSNGGIEKVYRVVVKAEVYILSIICLLLVVRNLVGGVGIDTLDLAIVAVDDEVLNLRNGVFRVYGPKVRRKTRDKGRTHGSTTNSLVRRR